MIHTLIPALAIEAQLRPNFFSAEVWERSALTAKPAGKLVGDIRRFLFRRSSFLLLVSGGCGDCGDCGCLVWERLVGGGWYLFLLVFDNKTFLVTVVLVDSRRFVLVVVVFAFWHFVFLSPFLALWSRSF